MNNAVLVSLTVSAAAVVLAACNSAGDMTDRIRDKVRHGGRCYAIVNADQHEFDCAAWDNIVIGNYWTSSLGLQPKPVPAPEAKPDEPKPCCADPDEQKPEAKPERRHSRLHSWLRSRVYGGSR